MDFNLDENMLWILGILALIFFLFPQKNAVNEPEKVEEEKKIDYIHRRNVKERKRLVY